MNYRALDQAGALHDQSVGLAMGAGTERLIYTIAPKVGRLIVTDLYGSSGGWIGAQSEQPIELIRKRLPHWSTPDDLSRTEAHDMDMRTISYPDESIDFCWSTGSFEHIGDDKDFDQHLREVHRVLKPGGVYAFTTAVCFGDETFRAPHNYLFSPDHLVAILNRSPLHPDPVFDCTIRDHIYNRPHAETPEDYGYAAAGFFTRPLISYRRGILLTANTVVLRKQDDTPKTPCAVVGLSKSTKMLKNKAAEYVKRLWAQRQTVSLKKMDAVLISKAQYFGADEIELSFVSATHAAAKIKVEVVSRNVTAPDGWRRETLQTIKPGRAVLCITALSDRIYQVRAHPNKKTPDDDIMMFAQRVND